MMKIKFDLVSFFIAVILLTFSCKGTDDEMVIDDNEEELITTVELTFTEGSETLIYRFADTDGVGGDDPVIDDIILAPNAVYQLSVRVLDESKSPAENITEEVEEEAEDHLFIYTVDNADMTIAIKDTDADGNPLGLTAEVTTSAESTGTLQVVLKHEADKATPTTTGETDVEATFAVKIQ